MDELKRIIIILFIVIATFFVLSGIEIITGNSVFINQYGGLTQESSITQISVSPKLVVLDKIGGVIIKDKIRVEVIPGTDGAYKKVEFFRKESSEVFEEFNLKCIGFSCRKQVTGYQIVDNKWKSGTYRVRVKDAGTQEYVETGFKVDNRL